MAKKDKTDSAGEQKASVQDFTTELISAINKECQERVAYNLGTEDAPTVVKRWLDTGSIQLNYAIRNAAEGGYPEGRIIEISGAPSSGKSHLAYHCAAVVQKLGGLVVYIDTENATPLTKLSEMGVDVTKKFVYIDEHCTENVFKVMESIITKAKCAATVKDVPILIVWDSLAATSPKQELEGDYDENTMGLQARVISKGMRKITGVLGNNNVTLIITNQLRMKIGVSYGDPTVTPGGQAVPFHSSVRIRLGSGSPVKDKSGNIIGSHVTVSVKKNKVGPPFKACEFNIIFGKGIQEDEHLFDALRVYSEKNDILLEDGSIAKIGGTGAWKSLLVAKAGTGEIIKEKKFLKSGLFELRKDPEWGPLLDKIIDEALTLKSCIANDEE